MIRKKCKMATVMLTSGGIQSRASRYTASSTANSGGASFSAVNLPFNPDLSLSPLNLPWSDRANSDASTSGIHTMGTVNHFREWFMSGRNPLFDQIFAIVRTFDGSSLDTALSQFNLHLSEGLVLDMLNYQKDDVLSCLKLFDWAGQQPGFHLTRPTFNAIFQILSKAKLMNLLLDFLQSYMRHKYVYKVRFLNVLVIGYAVAGKPETALHLFARMRFKGVDLDSLAYHILLNSLVEEGYFDVAETMSNQIRARGVQNELTHSIVMKSYCKQKELEKAEGYLLHLVENNRAQLSEVAVGTFVDALCKDNQFERAAVLIEDFRNKGLVLMEHAYGTWIKNLVKVGKLDGALEFLKDKQAGDGYIPDVFRYNLLICRLLRDNRLEDVYDLLEEMKENEIVPDNMTMNAILCFLCKAGRMDIAMGLYDSREEFGLSVSCMTYNYLINTLLGDGSVDEAYPLLKKSLEQGYFPGTKTLTFIVDALYREGKLDKMKELVLFALEKNFMPNNVASKFIAAMCRASRVEEGYLVHSLLNGLNKLPLVTNYMDLIRGFSKVNRGDMAAKLLIEMQDKGYHPRKRLVRDVIGCLCKSNDAENQFFRLLEMQLARCQSSTPDIYNLFIYAAGHAKKPEFARKVHEMSKSGSKPNNKSGILVLNSYLKSGNIYDALHLFHDISKNRSGRKLWSTMIIGLCKAKRQDYASQIMDLMRSRQLIPSNECYEELIKLYCGLGQYDKAVAMINDMIHIGRPVSSFIGNICLLHAMKDRRLYDAWSTASHKQTLTPTSWMLGNLVGAFSGFVERNHDEDDVEKMIDQCFPTNTFTCNMLLRRAFNKGVDDASKYLDSMHEKGHEPNQWTYDIIVHGLAKHGQMSEARKWLDEMLRRGFELTEATKKRL